MENWYFGGGNLFKMQAPESAIQFTSLLERFDSLLWGHHFVVPAAIGQVFIEGNDRRVVCVLNGSKPFQCALMPKGEGAFFINVNKKLRDQLRIKVGSPLDVTLWKDDSEYGLPMPEELEELLRQDEEGHRYLHALTPGKLRTMLYYVGSPKTAETRLMRAVAVVEHLKMMQGKIDFKILMGKKEP